MSLTSACGLVKSRVDSEASAADLGSAAELGITSPSDPVPPAYASAEWYDDFRRDMAWVMNERVAWQPMAVQRVLDVETETVNVHDRRRDTWTAPECSCRRVSVWMYGGSGAFGLGQRDMHTIASELAQLAFAEDVVLDVQNRGIPGQMHWRNATRLSWDLTQEPAPDLVVFYEGAEEVQSELELERRGLGNVLAPFESFLTNLYDEVMQVPEDPPPPPAGVERVGWPRLDDRPRPTGQLAAERYERSLDMSRGIAAYADLPVRYYWQPSRFDMAAGDGSAPAAEESPEGEAYRGASAALPDDVVDLSGALATLESPVFSDATNHNEFGAGVVAGLVWEDLRALVLELAGEGSQG